MKVGNTDRDGESAHLIAPPYRQSCSATKQNCWRLRPPIPVKLFALFQRGGPPFVQIGCEVVEMDPLRAFLRSFHADEGEGDVTGRHLADELLGRQLEKVLCHVVSRNDRPPRIHRHQHEGCIHDSTLILLSSQRGGGPVQELCFANNPVQIAVDNAPALRLGGIPLGCRTDNSRQAKIRPEISRCEREIAGISATFRAERRASSASLVVNR